MEQIRSNGEQQELRDEIVDLGTRYGIVTPYTSYLALEPNAVVGGNAQNISGFMMNRAQRSGTAPAAPAPKAADAKAITGMAGVQQSKQARKQQEVVMVEAETASSAIRSAGGKTFYLRDNVWTDSEFKAGSNLPESVIKFGSDDYFALLKQKPRLGQFLSLGEQVVVVFEGQVYRITPATP
jgi:Ca-activated chloride channel family protein